MDVDVLRYSEAGFVEVLIINNEHRDFTVIDNPNEYQIERLESVGATFYDKETLEDINRTIDDLLKEGYEEV